MDLLIPDSEQKVCKKQVAQKWQHDQHCWERELFIGQKVMAKNLKLQGPTWVPGVVVERLGRSPYLLDTSGWWNVLEKACGLA